MNKKKRIRALEQDMDDLLDAIAAWQLQTLDRLAGLEARAALLEQRRGPSPSTPDGKANWYQAWNDPVTTSTVDD